jgi:hypothetical protein
MKIGGLLAEFDGLEVSNKILYRALVLSFSDFRSVRRRILFLLEENQKIELSHTYTNYLASLFKITRRVRTHCS